MGMEEVAAAMERVEAVLRRKPHVGIHDDAPATARWENGTRVVATDGNGAQVATDMPAELGGAGGQVTPGWLFRAGLASCLATVIAMNAAAAKIALTRLEVRASSRSDLRGILGMNDGDGERVWAGPDDVQMHVTISATGEEPARLRELVERSRLCSPVPAAVQDPVPLLLRIEIA